MAFYDMQMLSAVWEFAAPMWVELMFLVCFTLGFSFLRADVVARFLPSSPGKGKKMASSRESGHREQVVTFDTKLKKQIEADASAGNHTAVLAAWRSGKDSAPTPGELIRSIVHALLDECGDDISALASELIGHIRKYNRSLCNPRTIVTILDVVARAGKADMLDDLRLDLQRHLRIPPSIQVYEVLLGGFAVAGNEQAVKGLMTEMKQTGLKLTARAHSVLIKGFLKNKMVDGVLQQMLAMRQEGGYYIPPFALTEFFRIACDAGRGPEVFSSVSEAELWMPAEATWHLLESCVKVCDLQTAKAVEAYARKTKVALCGGSFDALLKLYANAADLKAIDLFEEMQQSQNRISEGLCVGLLARCAESKFLRFAEVIVKYVRATEGMNMTIAMYSALMKVYAYSNLYAKACDLYDQLLTDGLTPDSMMYGCLMKFSVECGRTDLSRALSEKAPTLDIQNYMSLIRAAGRDKDVDRAFAVLKRLKDTGVLIDVAANNCVLDVCVSCNDMNRARAHVEEMKKSYPLDIITYNTLLKGYCYSGDIPAARGLLIEMRQAGHNPNDVSYNCLINAAVTSGDSNLAWTLIAEMEAGGIVVDQYTVSIMMKGLKRCKNQRDIARTLALLDKSSLDVCSDEILLNTVLETCIRHREFRRLEDILNQVRNTSIRPSMHTYGSLIKACGTLKRTDQCWHFWKEMTQDRAMVFNEMVLGCMLDALVCNKLVEDAVSLWKECKGKVAPNSIIYSTIIKGFANSHQAGRAMDIWREMRSEGVTMNTVVYNAVVDAQARVGLMDEVNLLVRSMEPDGCTPDVITFSTIVKGYCVNGDLETAFAVFGNMQQNNMANDSVVYNTLLDGCTRHSRWDLADKVLESMKVAKVVPTNFTLGVVVKMYGRRKQIDKAFTAFDEIPAAHGFKANSQVRTCLMSACLSNNSVDRAFEVFQGLKEMGFADAKAYQNMINGCARTGDFERGVALVEELYSMNRQLQDTDALEQLLRALGRHGLMEQVGMPLVEKLRSGGTPVSTRLLSSVLNEVGNARQPRNQGNGYYQNHQNHQQYDQHHKQW